MSGTITTLMNVANGAAAYQRTDQASPAGGADFGKYLSGMMTSTINQGTSAEQLAHNGLLGHGNLTQVVTSVAQAQLALQTTVAIRDRLIQAYQSIMSMPI